MTCLIIGALLFFFAGLAEGTQDKISFHYYTSFFSRLNPTFWNPEVSYLNKYRDRDSTQPQTFRGKYLVFTTDAWHLVKFISRWSAYAGAYLLISSLIEYTPTWTAPLFMATAFSARSLGFNLIWKFSTLDQSSL